MFSRELRQRTLSNNTTIVSKNYQCIIVPRWYSAWYEMMCEYRKWEMNFTRYARLREKRTPMTHSGDIDSG